MQCPFSSRVIKSILPERGCLKIIFDGAVDQASGVAAGSFVIPDFLDRLLTAGYVHLDGYPVVEAVLKESTLLSH